LADLPLSATPRRSRLAAGLGVRVLCSQVLGAYGTGRVGTGIELQLTPDRWECAAFSRLNLMPATTLKRKQTGAARAPAAIESFEQVKRDPHADSYQRGRH
jgi:hypothetical protein